MIVSGFTFIRNGVRLGYPFVESIQSVLPICDEFIVALGDSEDGTRERLAELDSTKVRIIPTQWNEAMRFKGYVYGQQKMIAQFCCKGDWAFYLEGDEVVHEQDLPVIRTAMETHLHDSRIEAFAFRYLHFYGSPHHYMASPGWYRREPRIVRNTIRSIAPDGLYFVILDPGRRGKRGRYPRARELDAPIYHYGHVRSVAKMRDKMRHVAQYWSRSDEGIEDYGNVCADFVRTFDGTHPAIIQEWLANEAEQELSLNPDYRPTRRDVKHRLMMRLESRFGVDLSKKHYHAV